MHNDEVQGYIVMEAVSEPMKPKIIQTVNEPNIFYVRFESCLQSFDVFNRNRRNYALEPMREAFLSEHIQELIRKGTWCGENGHPDSNDVKRILSIDMTKVCHRIVDYEFRGNMVYGTIETLNDRAWGQQFSMHVLQGLHPSFSLRALAAITKTADGRGIIKTKPHGVCYDRVVLPSHKEAYMDNSKQVTIIQTSTESTNPIYDSNAVNPAMGNTFENSISVLEESAIPSALDYIKEESKRFKELTTFFNNTYGKITLVDESTVMLQGEDAKLFIKVEDYIRNDIHNFMTKLR